MVVGKEDKRGLTAMVSSNAAGEMLPSQLIYQGKTERSLPVNRAIAEADGHLFCATESHWQIHESYQAPFDEVSQNSVGSSVSCKMQPTAANILQVACLLPLPCT